jgi:hypothetical protein
VLLLLALTGWKAMWVSKGYGISLPNDPSAWASARTRLEAESTVLVGTSRMQVGIVREEWAVEMDGELPLQLSLVGTSPVPLLTHIAEETDFRGLAILGVVELFMFDGEATNARALQALADYRNLVTSPSRRASVRLSRYVPNSLLVRHRSLGFKGILQAMWERNAPRNPVSNMREDRWMAFDMSRLKPEEVDHGEAENYGRVATVAERDSIIAELESAVAKIQARGGRVVIVATPACRERLEIEERRYPRETYWEPLAAATSAVTINSYDFPALLKFTCADGSHLTEPDARRFTRELARVIREQL